jgi:hypothetical protein
MTYEDLLARIIEDGIAEVRATYADPKRTIDDDIITEGSPHYIEPKDVHRLAGALAGFEACRGKSLSELAAIYAQADQACVESRRVDIESNNAYWEKRYATLQIEWICNVVSAGLINNGKAPLLPWLPTARGVMKYSEIVGVGSEGGDHIEVEVRDGKPIAFQDLPADAFPVTLRFRSGKTDAIVWERVITKPEGGALAQIEIPSFRDTEHYPVWCEILYANGQTSKHTWSPS